MLGIAVDNNGTTLNIRARKAVIIATGGFTGNVDFRRMFDPRLTEEYCGLAGMPWSNQDASGELAGMAIGASLWGLYNQTGEFGSNLTKPGTIGSQYGYVNLRWMPGSPVFDRVRAIGLPVANWQDVILVNMLGKRFYDETGGQFTANDYNSINPYTQGSYLNAKNAKYNPNNFINAALAGIGDGHNGGGPIWAIFDADAVTREKWDPNPPNVDIKAGFFFSARYARRSRQQDQNAIPARCRCRPIISNRPWRATIPSSIQGSTRISASQSRCTRSRRRRSTRHGRRRWCTTRRAGLRINAKCQVMDMNGNVIPGLYCGGESAGGFSQHGLARATCQGYIAGNEAVGAKAQHASAG